MNAPVLQPSRGAVTILQGDVRDVLRTLPSAYFDCVVTSPPYWGLRDYGCDGQIGLERTLGEHLDVLVGIFREVRRVLKAHGTVWLNYGDCYAAAPNGKSAAAYKADGTDDRTFRDKPFSTVGPISPARTYVTGYPRDGSRGVDRDFHDHMRPKAGPVYETDNSKRQASRRGRSGNLGNGGINGAGIPNGRVVAGGFLKPKDLCMIPNRLAIALQDDGWWVRSEIIWHKPNPMPESTYDRPTSAHEKVWLLTKSEDYFYNHEAIREPVTGGAHVRAKAKGTDTGVGWGRLDDLDPGQKDRGRGRVKRTGPNSRVNVDRVPVSRKIKVPGGWDTQPGGHGTIDLAPTRKLAEPGSGTKNNSSMDAALAKLSLSPLDTRNARNVWTIAPRAYREAHFATFPQALAERCMKAGVPALACSFCGQALPQPNCHGACQITAAIPGCVLDPFGGAGTVGLVAQQLGVEATLIELNPEYVALTKKRLGFPEEEEPACATA